MIFRRVLLTGAAGKIGSCLRAGLRDELDELRLTDVHEPQPPPVPPSETFMAADLADSEAVLRAVDGVEAVVHLGAVPGEAAFDDLLGPNVVGAFNVFDAARRAGVRRVVYASSNHVTGFYPVDERLTGSEPPRPDGLYGATKAFGEALGRMYSDRFGLEVVCVRIGAFDEHPSEPHELHMWLSPGDAVRLFRACLSAPDLDFVTVYGASANARSWWDLGEAARRLGYEPQDDAERFAAEIDDTGPPAIRQGDPFTSPEYGGWT
jgi:uronate dehydrogenase